MKFILVISACAAVGAMVLGNGCGGGSPSAMRVTAHKDAGSQEGTCDEACTGWEAAGCAGDDKDGSVLAGCLVTCAKESTSWRACFVAAQTCPDADACSGDAGTR